MGLAAVWQKDRLKSGLPNGHASLHSELHMADDSQSAPQRILLLTGMLGAGKSTALRELEDLGWETIDNFPIRLLERLLAKKPHDPSSDTAAPLAIGFDVRTRDFVPGAIIELVKDLVARDDLEVTTVFLDCSDEELERRFNETRRRHPFANDRPVPAGIGAERELLASLRRWAEALIDTSAFSAKDLQLAIRDQFGRLVQGETNVTVSSFGFARGMPPVADYVFDMRFLDNPHWQEELRPQTGLDEPVADHIRNDPAFDPAFEAIKALLIELLPRFTAQGKPYVHIAFGCTGGRHRSVFTAESMAKALREAGFSPTVIHRNLQSRATDLLEGKPITAD